MPLSKPVRDRNLINDLQACDMQGCLLTFGKKHVPHRQSIQQIDCALMNTYRIKGSPQHTLGQQRLSSVAVKLTNGEQKEASAASSMTKMIKSSTSLLLSCLNIATFVLSFSSYSFLSKCLQRA